MKMLSLSLLLLGLTASAFATAVPEIDPASGVNALALLGGVGLVVRSWRRK